MATWSGTGSHNNNYTGTLTVTESSYSVANNTSTLSYSLVLTGNSGYYFQQTYLTTKIYIDGAAVQDRYEQISMPSPSGGVSTYTVCSGTTTVTHNADGTKTVSVYATMSTPTTQTYLPGTINIPSGLDGSLTLTTIPRASSMTVPTFTIGSAGTMQITSASSSFTHTITYEFADLTGTAATAAAGVTSVSWTPPSTFYAKIPYQTSGVGALTLHTYSGGTQIGTAVYSCAILVGDSIKPTAPTVTLTPVNTNAWISSKGLYVGGYTKLRVQSSATAGSGASMASYSVSGAFTATGADVTSSSALSAGSKTVTVTAADTRGRTNSSTQSVSFLSYANPTFATLTAERGTYSSGTWTANASGDHLRVTAVPYVSLSANGNTATVTVKIGATTPNATSGNYYYFTGTSASTPYTVTATITDAVGNTKSIDYGVTVSAVASSMTYGTLNIGESVTFTISRNNSNFTHTIEAEFGTNYVTVGTGIGTSKTWTIPSTWLATVPDRTTGIGAFYLKTYEGATLIGTRGYSVTLNVPASIKPTTPSITLSPVNTNAWINTQGLYVGGYTKLKVQSSATAGTGATMSSYSVTGAFTATGSNVTSSSTLSAGSKTVTVTATDSRGRTNSNSASVTFLEYTNPALTTFTAERGTYSSGTWTSNDQGDHIRVTAIPSIALSADGNAATVTVKIGATNPSATSGNYYYFTSTNSTTPYTVTGSVTDSVGNSSTRTMTVPTVEVPVNINVDLPGVGFGMIAQSAQTVQLAPSWKLRMTAETITPTITKSTGNSTLSGAAIYRSGNVCQLTFTLTATGTVSYGYNMFSGTVTSYPAPIATATGVGTIYGNTLTAVLETNGTLYIRNTSEAFSTGSVYISIIYLTNS